MISFKHKFIFIKTKKVAGTSVSALLRNFAGEDDIVPCVTPRDEYFCAEKGQFSKNYSRDLSLEREYTRMVLDGEFERALEFLHARTDIIFPSHNTAARIKKQIESKGYNWEDFYKFTIDRHPYDFVFSLSSYNNKAYNRGEEMVASLSSIEKRAIRYIEKERVNKNSDIYTDQSGLLVDKIIKFEELDKGLKEVFDDVGIKSGLIELPKLKINSKTISYNDVFDDELKSKIYSKFESTFELLGYKR